MPFVPTIVVSNVQKDGLDWMVYDCLRSCLAGMVLRGFQRSGSREWGLSAGAVIGSAILIPESRLLYDYNL